MYNRLIDGRSLWEQPSYIYSTPGRLNYASNLEASTIKSYTYSDDEFKAIIEDIWEEAYATILNINVILDNAEQKRGSVLVESDYNLIKGDLLALRAFLHFDMLRLFGPVYSRNPDQLCIIYNDSRTAQAYPQLSARSIIYDHFDSRPERCRRVPSRV